MGFETTGFEITLKDVDLSPFAEERIERRLEKIVQRIERERRVRVSLSSMHGEYRAHVQIVIAGRNLVGKGASRETAIAAFDEAVSRLERRVSRLHEKRKRTDRGLRGASEMARMERSWARWQAS